MNRFEKQIASHKTPRKDGTEESLDSYLLPAKNIWEQASGDAASVGTSKGGSFPS